MSDAQQAAIYSVVSHAPDWLRRELLSEDRVARTGAKEALAAMIANPLKKGFRDEAFVLRGKSTYFPWSFQTVRFGFVRFSQPILNHLILL